MILDPTTLRENNKYLLNYLVWLEPKNLIELDANVAKDNYSDSDFKYAVKTYYAEGIFCLNCNFIGNGFEVDYSNPYLGNKDLLSTKFRLIRERKSRLNCPNCNSPFRIDILKFLP
jgi:hypothetical protein